MRVGVISDTHNEFENAQWAADVLREYSISRVLHCGDITSPIMLEVFSAFDMSYVFGNMDRERAALRKSLTNDSIDFVYETTFDDKRIAVLHGDDLHELNDLINSHDYDYIFHGHTHLRRDETVGKTRVINPGALGGRKSQSRSLCIVDFATDTVEFIEKQ